MLNLTKRNIFHIGLISIVILGLTTFSLMMVQGPVAGQDNGTATSTSSGMDTSTPSGEGNSTSTDPGESDDDEVELILVEKCKENVLTGELDCVEKLEPPDGVVRGQSDTLSDAERKSRGLEPREGETVLLSDLGSSLSIGSSDPFFATARNLLSSQTYTLQVARTAGNTDIGFNIGCDTSQVSSNYASGLVGVSKGVTLYACNAGGATVTVKLLQGTTVIASTSMYVSVTTSQVDPSCVLDHVGGDPTFRGDSLTVSVDIDTDPPNTGWLRASGSLKVVFTDRTEQFYQVSDEGSGSNFSFGITGDFTGARYAVSSAGILIETECGASKFIGNQVHITYQGPHIPPTPVGVSATTYSSSSIRVSWNNISDVSAYRFRIPPGDKWFVGNSRFQFDWYPICGDQTNVQH